MLVFNFLGASSESSSRSLLVRCAARSSRRLSSPLPPLLICREFFPSRFRCNPSSFTVPCLHVCPFLFFFVLISIIRPAGWQTSVQALQIPTSFCASRERRGGDTDLAARSREIEERRLCFWNGSFASRSIRAGIGRGAPSHCCMSELIVGRAYNVGGLARVCMQTLHLHRVN